MPIRPWRRAARSRAGSPLDPARGAGSKRSRPELRLRPGALQAVIRSGRCSVLRANRNSSVRPRTIRRAAGAEVGPQDRPLGELHRRHTVADLTRRRFVKNSAGTVAGMTAIGALIAE